MKIFKYIWLNLCDAGWAWANREMPPGHRDKPRAILRHYEVKEKLGAFWK